MLTTRQFICACPVTCVLHSSAIDDESQAGNMEIYTGVHMKLTQRPFGGKQIEGNSRSYAQIDVYINVFLK